MKVKTRVFLLFITFVFLLSTAVAQSLGEVARHARKKKTAASPAQKVYTNENLPGGPMSMVSGPGADTSAQDATSGDKATATAKDAASPDAKKDQEEWRKKFAEQKNKILLLERELGVLQRENQVRAAVYYADAGARLRDEKKYSEDDRKYKSDIESKQKDLDAAKQRLEDMREEARKAGLPASVAE